MYKLLLILMCLPGCSSCLVPADAAIQLRTVILRQPNIFVFVFIFSGRELCSTGSVAPNVHNRWREPEPGTRSSVQFSYTGDRNSKFHESSLLPPRICMNGKLESGASTGSRTEAFSHVGYRCFVQDLNLQAKCLPLTGLFLFIYFERAVKRKRQKCAFHKFTFPA